MKRLALVLAASVIGMGCGSSSNPPPPITGSVDFSWSFVRVKDDASTATYGCAQAGIDNVIVSLAGGDVQVPCADQAGDGALIAGIVQGSQSVIITGRRGSAALYSSQASITVVGNQTTSKTVQVFGIPDDLDIFAHFMDQFGTAEAWLTCGAAGVDTLSYSLVDFANTVVAAGSVPCPAANAGGVSFRGAAALDRDNYAIRMQAFPTASAATFDSATTEVAPTCSGQSFNHFGPQVNAGGRDVFLYDITLNATLCP